MNSLCVCACVHSLMSLRVCGHRELFLFVQLGKLNAIKHILAATQHLTE